MVNGSGGGQTVEDNNYVWWNQIHNRNHWIEIRVRSATDPLGPLGLGAKVTVYRAGTHQILGDDELRTDFGYRSRRDAVLHFGLADVRSVDIPGPGSGTGIVGDDPRPEGRPRGHDHHAAPATCHHAPKHARAKRRVSGHPRAAITALAADHGSLTPSVSGCAHAARAPANRQSTR